MITASTETLMRQAPITIEFYLSQAVKSIDGQFGEGYAAKNPQLVSAFITASAQDFHTAMLVKAGEDDSRVTRVERVIVSPKDTDQ